MSEDIKLEQLIDEAYNFIKAGDCERAGLLLELAKFLYQLGKN